jgi:hypothetical protein
MIIHTNEILSYLEIPMGLGFCDSGSIMVESSKISVQVTNPIRYRKL